MRTSLRLGRVAGIEIGVNWTWFLVFGLIAWTLAGAVFPDQNPGLGTGAYWAMGLIAATLFFVSILLHELGHALQARRDDVEIDGITLWLFGGVARFKGMYESPGAEFRIAVAGPVVTVLIAAVLMLLAAVLPLPAAVDGVVSWLAYINIILLVFNLIPALPLDGGRILHAALWKRSGDLMRATRIGTAIGVTFGWLLIGGGIVMFFTTAAFGGLWLALIGWFLSSAAQAEAQQIVARRALGGLHVSDLMASDPVTVEPDMTLARFVDEVASRSRYTTYPVRRDGEALGLLALDAVAGTPRAQWEERRVSDCMIPRDRVPVVHAGDEAETLMQELAGGEVHRALVVEDGYRLQGLVSISDVLRAVQLDGFGRGGDRPAGALPRKRPRDAAG